MPRKKQITDFKYLTLNGTKCALNFKNQKNIFQETLLWQLVLTQHLVVAR